MSEFFASASSRKSTTLLLLIATASGIVISQPRASADAISPNIGVKDTVYSKEKPRSEFYGTGVSGRMSEASMLRFEGDQRTIEGKYDEAVSMLSKAVQLDASCPTGHLYLARALSGKLRTSPTLDEDLFKQCYQEWRLIRMHDADHENQFEAKKNLRTLKRIAKAIEEEKEPAENRKKRSFLAGTTGLLGKFFQ